MVFLSLYHINPHEITLELVTQSIFISTLTGVSAEMLRNGGWWFYVCV